ARRSRNSVSFKSTSISGDLPFRVKCRMIQRYARPAKVVKERALGGHSGSRGPAPGGRGLKDHLSPLYDHRDMVDPEVVDDVRAIGNIENLEVRLLPLVEASDAVGPTQRVGGVEGSGGDGLVHREPEIEAAEEQDQRHRLGHAGAGIEIGGE